MYTESHLPERRLLLGGASWESAPPPSVGKSAVSPMTLQRRPTGPTARPRTDLSRRNHRSALLSLHVPPQERHEASLCASPFPSSYGRGICSRRWVNLLVTHFSLLSNIPRRDCARCLRSGPCRKTPPRSGLGLQDIAAQNRPVTGKRLLHSGNGSLSLTHCFSNSPHGR